LPEEVTLHTPRHPFASLADDLGNGEAAIAGLLGHRRARISARNTRAADAVLPSAADELAHETPARSANGNATGRPFDVALRAGPAGVQADGVNSADGAR